MWDDEEQFGLFDGICAVCDTHDRVNDLGLCEECAGKLERDLIRTKDWTYSVTAFGMSGDQREELYREVVGTYGKDLELISPAGNRKKKTEYGRKRTCNHHGSS